jgi:hypothetical protein
MTLLRYSIVLMCAVEYAVIFVYKHGMINWILMDLLTLAQCWDSVDWTWISNGISTDYPVDLDRGQT